MRTTRFFVVMAALALVATACGGSAAETTAATEAPTTHCPMRVIKRPRSGARPR